MTHKIDREIIFSMEKFSEIAGEVPITEPLQGYVTSTINSKLFIGSLAAAEGIDFYRGARIKYIVTAAARLKVQIPSVNSDQPFCQLVIADLDDHPCASLLESLRKYEVFAFLDDAFGISSDSEAAGNVLVHCASGISRSASTIIAYLICRTKGRISFDEALVLVRQNRPSANPNIGFRRQLELLEKIAVEEEDYETKEGNPSSSKSEKESVTCPTSIGIQCPVPLSVANSILERAAAQWALEKPDVMREAVNDRNAANEAHEKLDLLEEEWAKIRSTVSGGLVAGSTSAIENNQIYDTENLNTLLQSLKILLDTNIEVPLDHCQDRVAKTIFRAAKQKAERILNEIEDTNRILK